MNPPGYPGKLGTRRQPVRVAEIAAGFLYLDASGKMAMVEYLTTNPAFSFTKRTVKAWHLLLEHIEKLAKEQGCSAIISMVAPGSSEEPSSPVCV